MPLLRRLDSFALIVLALGAVALGGYAITTDGSATSDGPEHTLAWAIPLTAIGVAMLVVSLWSAGHSPHRRRLLGIAVSLGCLYVIVGLIRFALGTH